MLVSAIFFLDRISKLYVLNFVEKNQTLDLFESSYLNITLIWNKGIAFGLFSFDQSSIYNIISLLISIICIIIIFLISKNEGIKKYSLVSIFGGAISNLFDRYYYTAVPDFIDLHINNFHWFIFNVADIFITIGVICLIYAEIFINKKVKKANE